MSLSPDFITELRTHFTGDLRLDTASRILYSTDASMYQIEPRGVAIPKTQDDLQSAVELAAKYKVAILPRGAGSSLGGQAVGEALILDCSRWLDSILEIDTEAMTATVEPGVVLASLRAGRIMGFLGPKGAGKTTSIRILTTMLEPDSGQFSVGGFSSAKYPEKIRSRIGVLPENLGFPRQMTGIEYLTFFGQLYGQPTSQAREYGMKLLEDVGLQQRGKSLIGTYSHGMRQRIGIARALVNDPVVVFLDEPTLGLDPRGQQELLELIQRIARERGPGVVLCSHLLSEIETVCDDVVILNAGQIVARGTVTEVAGRVQHNIILRNALRVQVPPSFVEKAQQILKEMPIIAQVGPIGEMEGSLRLELENPTNGGEDIAYQINNNILSALIRVKIPILSFEAEGGKLQDVFLHLTEETIK